MEIYNKANKLVEFSVVTAGQTFMFDNEVCMAVRPFEVRPNFEYQAVCLNDGTLCRFKTDALVIPCKMFGTVEKMGEFR